MRQPYQSPGGMKNSSYYIAPVGDWTHDLQHTVASNMVKLGHYVLHTRTLSQLDGLTRRSFLNQVTLSLWSFANLTYVILSFVGYTLHHCKKRIHIKNMSHVCKMKPLCATG